MLGQRGPYVAGISCEARSTCRHVASRRKTPISARSVVSIDGDRALAWIEKGAQPTEQVGKLLEITGVWEQYRAKHGAAAAAAPKAHAPAPPKAAPAKPEAKAAEAPAAAAPEAAESAAEAPEAEAPEAAEREAEAPESAASDDAAAESSE